MSSSVHPIVGAWELQSFSERNIADDAVSYPMGAKPRAMVIYASTGHVATIFAATDRSKPLGLHPTDIEAAQLFRTMVAFAGRYELDGNKLLYYPAISWNESWNGSEQVRFFDVLGDVLHVRSVPTKSVLIDAITEMSMTWIRVKP